MEDLKLTDDQIDLINDQMNELLEETPSLKVIADMPSNNGQETTDPSTREDGEYKMMNVSTDPNTGEMKILGSDSSLDDNETFEEMCVRIEIEDISFEQKPITFDEISNYLNNKDDSSLLSDMNSKDFTISNSSITKLLDIVNRKMNNEKINAYREFPEEIQNMINEYMSKSQIPICSTEGKTFRNMISEQLLEEFIFNISVERNVTDFNKEIESLFSKGTNELADNIVGYTEERNKTYREYANKMDDPEKKEKINNILDQIDEAYNLTTLKEFSKRCKVKKYDLEKPERWFSNFLRKYANSNYNIYDINLARPILYRNLNTGDSEEFTSKDINAFFVVFCKQCQNYNPSNTLEHAYMYYTIYNIVLMDINKGEKKDVSNAFINNLKEVIMNIRERNNNYN